MAANWLVTAFSTSGKSPTHSPSIQVHRLAVPLERLKSDILSQFLWKGAAGKFRTLLVRFRIDRYLARTIENE